MRKKVKVTQYRHMMERPHAGVQWRVPTFGNIPESIPSQKSRWTTQLGDILRELKTTLHMGATMPRTAWDPTHYSPCELNVSSSKPHITLHVLYMWLPVRCHHLKIHYMRLSTPIFRSWVLSYCHWKFTKFAICHCFQFIWCFVSTFTKEAWQI